MFAILSIVVHQAGIDNNDNERHDGDHQGNAPTMSKTTTKKGAAATTKKPPVGMKTTGDDEADLVVSRPVSKLYGFGTDNKYAVSLDTEGMTDYCLVSFFVCCPTMATPSLGATPSTASSCRWSIFAGKEVLRLPRSSTLLQQGGSSHLVRQG